MHNEGSNNDEELKQETNTVARGSAKDTSVTFLCNDVRQPEIGKLFIN